MDLDHCLHWLHLEPTHREIITPIPPLINSAVSTQKRVLSWLRAALRVGEKSKSSMTMTPKAINRDTQKA
jgi:hypothetical protein